MDIAGSSATFHIGAMTVANLNSAVVESPNAAHRCWVDIQIGIRWDNRTFAILFPPRYASPMSVTVDLGRWAFEQLS